MHFVAFVIFIFHLIFYFFVLYTMKGKVFMYIPHCQIQQEPDRIHLRRLKT